MFRSHSNKDRHEKIKFTNNKKRKNNNNNNNKNKNKNKNKKNVQITINNNANKNVSKPNQRGKVLQSPVFRRYAMCLANPFSEKALNAKVPDMYNANTTCLHNRGRTIITSDAIGDVSFVFIGHPELTYILHTPPHSTSLTKIGATPVYSVTTDLSSKLSSYRVVSNGVKIENIQAPLNMTGRMYCAQFNMTDDFFSPEMMAVTAPDGNVLLPRLCGVVSEPVTDYVPLSISNANGVKEYTAANMTSAAVYANNRPVAPDAFKFSDSKHDSTYATGYTQGTNLLINASGNVSFAATSSSVDTSGWTCLLFRGSGFPENTKVLAVDHMIHLEGTPTLSSGDTAGFIGSATSSKPVGGALEAALNFAKNIPASKLISAVGGAMGLYDRLVDNYNANRYGLGNH